MAISYLPFIQRQVAAIKRGGPEVALRKTRLLLRIVLAILVVLAVRALRPVFVVRFRALSSHTIGAFTSEPEVYLCERDAGMHPGRAIDIFYYDRSLPVINLQLKNMWDRTLRISSFASIPDKLDQRLPQRHLVPLRPDGARDIYGLLSGTEPHISFTDEEEQQGRAALLELGIPEGVPFVCFHARDPAYIASVKPEWDRAGSTYGNCSIHNFLPAVEEMTRLGYYTVRMGSVVEAPLPSTGPNIIDYATNGRTDFLDIYLSAKCHFLLGCGSGLYTIPMIFRRPLVITNLSMLEYVPAWSPDILFIPKKLWSRRDRRFLSYREILDSGIGRFNRTQQHEQAGIDLIENTPEEITAVAMEMEKRIKGTWQTTEEDEAMQQRFWSLFKPSKMNQVFVSRFGAQFLRQNRELLECGSEPLGPFATRV